MVTHPDWAVYVYWDVSEKQFYLYVKGDPPQEVTSLLDGPWKILQEAWYLDAAKRQQWPYARTLGKPAPNKKVPVDQVEVKGGGQLDRAKSVRDSWL